MSKTMQNASRPHAVTLQVTWGGDKTGDTEIGIFAFRAYLILWKVAL